MSSDVVPQDIKLNQSLALKALEEAFSLKPKAFELIGEGWDNLVFLMDEEFIFRFSRRQVAVPLIEREMALLSQFPDSFQLSIPKPQFCSQGTKAYPFPFYGHKKVDGKTGCQVILSRDEQVKSLEKLAHFLKKLHSLDYKALATKKDPLDPVFDRADIPRMSQFFDERLDAIKEFYDFEPFKKGIEKIKQNALNYKASRETLAFVHGDLYHRHLVFNEKHELCGVIDWGDCCVSDPIVDLAILFQFYPEALHKHFFDVYGEVSSEAYDYAKFLGLYYAVALLWYGHDRKDESLINHSLFILKRLCL